MSIINYEYFGEASNFSFSYNGSGPKENRHYLSFIVESSTGEKRLFLIVYRVNPNSSNDVIITVGNNLAQSFKELLSKNDLVNETHNINYENKRGLIN